MMAMRRKTASPALSTKSLSPQMGWRVDGSPYLDMCPPTPMWESSPVIGARAQTPLPDNVLETQFAWTAYQACSRRMNSACVANRSQSLEEQRAWWEETSSICRNAILLHNATLNKQYNAETAKNLELLEGAYHVVQTMLESLSSRREVPVEVVAEKRSLSLSIPSEPIALVDEPESSKRSRRPGLTNMFGKFINHLTTKDPQLVTEKMGRPDSVLY